MLFINSDSSGNMEETDIINMLKTPTKHVEAINSYMISRFSKGKYYKRKFTKYSLPPSCDTKNRRKNRKNDNKRVLGH